MVGGRSTGGTFCELCPADVELMIKCFEVAFKQNKLIKWYFDVMLSLSCHRSFTTHNFQIIPTWKERTTEKKRKKEKNLLFFFGLMFVLCAYS